jgi:hypothetical protein
VDEDSFGFRVDPPDAEITFERPSLDNGETLPLFVGPQRTPISTLPFKFRPDVPGLSIPDIDALLLVDGKPISPVPMGAYLAVVPAARTKADEDLPLRVRDRLHELGYIVDDKSDAQPPD